VWSQGNRIYRETYAGTEGPGSIRPLNGSARSVTKRHESGSSVKVHLFLAYVRLTGEGFEAIRKISADAGYTTPGKQCNAIGRRERVSVSIVMTGKPGGPDPPKGLRVSDHLYRFPDLLCWLRNIGKRRFQGGNGGGYGTLTGTKHKERPIMSGIRLKSLQNPAIGMLGKRRPN
jgi:hypothetical protein